MIIPSGLIKSEQNILQSYNVDTAALKKKQTAKAFHEKPPVAVEVEDLLSLARLATTRSDYPPLLWWFPLRGKHVIAHMTSIPFWKGNIPILAYVWYEDQPPPYIAYTNLEKEEVKLTTTPEAGKYINCVVVEIEETPHFVAEAVRQRSSVSHDEKPIMVRARSLASLMRLVATMSDSTSTPPIWHLAQREKHLLGILYPFFDYYNSTTLPLFFYMELRDKPAGPYIRYLPSDAGEELDFASSVTDLKYVYGRVVSVKNLPFRI